MIQKLYVGVLTIPIREVSNRSPIIHSHCYRELVCRRVVRYIILACAVFRQVQNVHCLQNKDQLSLTDMISRFCSWTMEHLSSSIIIKQTAYWTVQIKSLIENIFQEKGFISQNVLYRLVRSSLSFMSHFEYTTLSASVSTGWRGLCASWQIAESVCSYLFLHEFVFLS